MSKVSDAVDASTKIWDNWHEPITAKNVGEVRTAAMRAALEAVSSIHEPEPEGWVLVPKEPTPEMLISARTVDFDAEDERAVIYNIWNCLFAASPKPVQGQVGAISEKLPYRLRYAGATLKGELGELMFAAADALDAVPISKGVTVKALEWWENVENPSGRDTFSYIGECHSLVGIYRIGRADDGWVARFNGGVIARGLETLEAAKSAAQADFDARILSCLSHTAGEIEAGGEVDLVEQLRLQAKHEKDFFEGDTHASRAMIAAASHIEAADKRIAELEAALKPFADAVFNDNGDVTYDTSVFGRDDLWAARAALSTHTEEKQ